MLMSRSMFRVPFTSMGMPEASTSIRLLLCSDSSKLNV